jgi:cell division protein FtsW
VAISGSRVRTGRGTARGSGAQRLVESWRAVFDRPLTSYYLLLGAAMLLTLLGLVMVLSASTLQQLTAGQSVFALFGKQALWAAVGLPLMWLATKMPVRTFRMAAYPLVFLSITLLLLVLVPGLGYSAGGNTNWLDLGGPFRIQPSELAKLALVLWSADLLARKERLLRQWRHLLVPLVPATVLVVGLVMLGGDMGTSLIIVSVLFAVLWVAGAPGRVFGTMLGSAGFLIVLGILARPSRLRRVGGFLDPFADPQNTGYQAVHGIYALAGGGLWGVGLGASREKGVLPEAHTDFIFAIIGEELGLVGTLSVLLLFAALGYAGIRVAFRTRDCFVRLAAAGVTAWLMAQALINVGAVVGVLPIAGVPLPLVSYGGSALLPTMFAVGMLLSFAKREPSAARALAARGPGRLRRAAARLRDRAPIAAAPARGKAR